MGMRAGAKSQGNISSRIRIVSGDSSVGSENGKCGCTRTPPSPFWHSRVTGNTDSALHLIRSLAAVLPRKTTPQSADRTQTQSLAWSISRLLGEQLENFTHEVLSSRPPRKLEAERTSQMFERCCEGKAPAQWSSIYAQSPSGCKERKSIFYECARARGPCPVQRSGR